MDHQGISAPEDLPPFETLWARAALAAALMHGDGDDDPFFLHRAEDGLIRYDDYGGNHWWLLRVEGGRGVLVGQDHESDTIFLDEEGGDLFGDGPDWLPWTWLLNHEQRHNIGFLYWWDGRNWARTPYPDGIREDGVRLNLENLLTEEGLVERLTDSTGRGEENGEEISALLPELVRAARDRELTEQTLSEALALLHEETDPAAGMRQADALGLTPDGDTTAWSAGHRRPLRPDLLAYGSQAFGLRYGDTLRCTEEIPGRPVPEDGPELLRLADWARRERLGPDGRAILGHNAIGANWPAVPECRELPEEEALWRALFEAEAHPEHGGWLYARLEVTERDHRLRRAYDHWPTWWNEHASGPAENGLIAYSFVSWLRKRAPRWQPDWVARWHHATPPPPVPESWNSAGGPAPSFPLTPFSPGEQEELLGELREALTKAVEGEWAFLHLDAHTLVDHLGVVFRATHPDGTQERSPGPPNLLAPLTRLREGMYERGTGTWYRASFTVDSEGIREERYDFDTEPDFGRRIDDISYQLDFPYFPCEYARTPDWMRRRIAPEPAPH